MNIKITLKRAVLSIFCFVVSLQAIGQLLISGDVYIDQGAEMHIAVNETLFDRGEVLTDRSSNNGVLSFAGHSRWSNANHSGHVNGFARMHHDDHFNFPVGHDGVFQPVLIERLDVSSPVDFAYSHIPHDNLTTEFGIDKVSDVFYWTVKGNQPAHISLSWNAFSNVDVLTGNNLDNIGIAGYDGSTWRFIEAEVDAIAFHDNKC